MKLSQVPNLRVEDFDSQKDWIGRLFIQLNPFIQAVNQVFEGNVDYGINIKSITKEYDISAFQPFSFTWPYSNIKPVELNVVKATKGDGVTPAILLAAWSYSSTDNLITVSQMIDLTGGSASPLSGKYQFSIRVTV